MKFSVFVMSLIFACSSLPSFAAVDNLSQAINESGRLRMLSQRIAKSYILLGLDIQPEKTQQQFASSKIKFESNLHDLKQFAQSLNKVAIVNNIEVIEQHWSSYSQIFNQPFAEKNTADLLAQSDITLMACETVVKQFQELSTNSSARLVNISGRQRMLSQRIAKLYSAMSLSIYNQQYTADLLQAVNEFELALTELQQSTDNTHFVNHKLRKVATQWNFSKQGFKVLDNGSSTPLVIAMTTETILRQMNDITALYEEIDKNNKLANL